jgi:intraflagellar transport protein 122
VPPAWVGFFCRDYVKKVAVYKDRVAVQLPSRVVLYKLDSTADDMDMQYRSAAKINQKLECNLLVVTSNHILLCQVCGLEFLLATA